MSSLFWLVSMLLLGFILVLLQQSSFEGDEIVGFKILRRWILISPAPFYYLYDYSLYYIYQIICRSL